MTFNQRLNNLRNRVGEISDLAKVAYGIWFADEYGRIIENSGPIALVPRAEVNNYKVLLMPQKNMSRKEWLELSMKHHNQIF